MEKTANEKIITIKPNITIVIGFYIQDFDDLPVTDSKTGETTLVSLHRVLLQCVGNIDPERWGVENGNFCGSGVSELKVPLAGISYLFGYSPDDPDFRLIDELKKLCYKPVHLDYGLNNKGRTRLRSISVIE